MKFPAHCNVPPGSIPGPFAFSRPGAANCDEYRDKANLTEPAGKGNGRGRHL